jgi:hypothetical protein
MRRTPLALLALLGTACGSPTARRPIALIDPANPPKLLSELGLYADPKSKTVAADAFAFEPLFKLWSDGAEKLRWIRVPEGAAIDTTDADHWHFPVGTELFKEFSYGGKRVETRFTQRIGDRDGAEGSFMASYAWRDDESDADLVLDGRTDARGTGHDIPGQRECVTCHQGDPSTILGFSFIQLQRSASAEEPRWAVLDRQGLFARSPGEHPAYVVPGDATESQALGYLHANCGHCHNPSGFAFAFNHQILRLSVGQATPEETDIRRTTVDVPVAHAVSQFDAPYRIVPGHPENSALYLRFTRRDEVGMPLLGSIQVDTAAATLVADWIRGLAR